MNSCDCNYGDCADCDGFLDRKFDKNAPCGCSCHKRKKSRDHDRLEAENQRLREAVNRAEEVLKRIAKPALGGKHQQFAAQQYFANKAAIAAEEEK